MPLHFGAAFAEEGGDALLRVLAAEGGGEAALLGLDALVEVGAVGDELDLLAGDRRLGGQLAPPHQRRLEQLVVGDDAVGEAELERLLGEDRVADQVHLERLVGADQARQPLGAAEAGDDPELDLGLAEDRRLGGDPDVAGHRQLAAAAERDRVDRRDRRDAALAELAQQGVGRSGSAPCRSPSSIWVNALMSAPAEKTSGIEEAITIAPTPSAALTRSQTVRRSRITSGEIAFIGRLASQAIATLVAGLELDGLGLLAVVGLRVGVEALARAEAEPALGDEPLEDHRRREPLAVFLLELLDPLEHLVEPLDVGSPERWQQAFARVEAGAGHHPDVDVADRADALFDQAAGLDQGAAGEHRDQLLGVGVGVAGDRLLAVLVEALAAGLGAELAVGDEPLQPLVDVEAVAVGVGEVFGDV